MTPPRRGESVHVWPTHKRVQNGATSFERWMPLEGRVVVWDRWWQSRFNDGDVLLHDPRPAAADSTKPAAEVVLVPDPPKKKGDR